MDDFYWELTLMSKDKILIPPEYVATVKRKWAAGEQITTNRQVVPAHQIVNFEQTSRRRAGTNLIEDVARAFNEPITRVREFNDGTTDEAVSVKWVKKHITQREWDRYYSVNGYKRLNSSVGIVIVACRVPTHLIDPNKVQYCSTEEVLELTK